MNVVLIGGSRDGEELTTECAAIEVVEISPALHILRYERVPGSLPADPVPYRAVSRRLIGDLTVGRFFDTDEEREEAIASGRLIDHGEDYWGDRHWEIRL